MNVGIYIYLEHIRTGKITELNNTNIYINLYSEQTMKVGGDQAGLVGGQRGRDGVGRRRSKMSWLAVKGGALE